MKRSDTGDFCVLYIEPDDEKAALFQVIMEQKKPIVIMLTGKGALNKSATDSGGAVARPEPRVFQRPEDFAELKHLKRQLDMPVLFVISGSEHLVQLAARHGFPVYLSMDALADAITAGHQARQRGMPRKTIDLAPLVPKKTIELQRDVEPVARQRSAPLLATGPSGPVNRAPTIDQGVIERDVLVERSANGGATVYANFNGNVPLVAFNPHNNGSLGNSNLSVATPTVSDIASYPTQENKVVGMDAPRMPNNAPTPRTLPPTPPVASKKKRVNRLALGVVVLLLFALLTAGLGYFLLISHTLPTDAPAMTNVIVGKVSFLSSNQISESSNQGLNDKVLVDLNNLANPAAGKSYYAWLMGDKNQGDTRTMLLGTLQVNNGHAQLLYAGDQSHTNLLAITSRFLVTEEDAATPPLSPTPDYTSWRYYGEFSQTPIKAADNTNNYSYLDHLRHLLAADPTLNELELPGGLNTWFYRNVSKILEWTSSTREQWQETNDPAFVRRQTLRTLTYLDGVSFVAQDLPPSTGLNVNERLARIGLLQINGSTQDPPSFLAHLSHHLYGLLTSGAVTPEARKNVAAIVTALDNVQSWLEQTRHDALQIMKMSDQSLRQPGTLSLLNDMIDNTTHAFTGQVDPTTGQMRQGVIWIHDQIEALATLQVQHITANGPALQLVPDNNVRRATILPTTTIIATSSQSVVKEVHGGKA